MMHIGLQDESLTRGHLFTDLVQRLDLRHDAQAALILVMTEERLELRERNVLRQKGVYVDFASCRLTYRRRFGGGQREAIAKSVGIKAHYRPSVIDATAGLGRDALVLAALGCQVTMLERHPVVWALLFDGLQRGYRHPEMGHWLQERLTLSTLSDVTRQAEHAIQPDVVYLDPMYPPNAKRALVKKEMRLLQLLVGSDDDTNTLLAPAQRLAKRRVVVKRPDYAPPLAQQAANSVIVSGNHRFDVYCVPPKLSTSECYFGPIT